MNIHLWGATVLREFCSSTGAALFKRGAVPTGPTSGHPTRYQIIYFNIFVK